MGEFIDIPKYVQHCKDLEHNAPTHIVVPEGKMYVHTCPYCHSVSYVINSEFTL